MTSVSIEREKLTAWEARMNTASTLLSATNSGAVIACLAGTIQSVGREIREELDAGTARNTAMKKQLNDAREELEKNITEHIEREEQHGDCQICGKDISCEECIKTGQDTCDDEDCGAVGDNLTCEEEPAAATQSKEQERMRNGSFAWTPEEESVLRTFSTMGDAVENANLPGRTISAISNKWNKLKKAGAILDKTKPFRYIGSTPSLFNRMGIINSYTDDRTRVNAEMMPDLKTIQINIRDITQEGIL